MKTVYFFDGKQKTAFMGLGQEVTLLQSCYFRGKELGYDNIIFEWHDKVSYPGWSINNTYQGLIKPPVNSIFQITIVNKGTRIPKHIDRIDLSEPNSLYDGCQPIMMHDYKMKQTHEYLNMYYESFGLRPVLSLPKSNKEKYILFHYRESTQERQIPRNTPYNEWKELFELLKDRYPSYKFKKIGEPSKLDNEFDEVYGYFPDDIGELFKVINNSSLYIGGAAGPITLTFLFGIPGIMLFDKNSKPSYAGETNAHKWVDPMNYMYLFENEYDINKDKDKILDFVKGRGI
ncbi:MAG: hypothetical protein IMZ52_07980 [Actinobacteria bacterium]|nr:hypothetical protein [Actinomycetota bacterium]MBE3114647.1 hypothetical protein [Actinomycetota bacterium]